MKTEKRYPVKLLELLSIEFPQVWDKIEDMHLENSQSGYSNWPSYCYLPSYKCENIVFAKVAEGNPTAMSYALKEKWVSKPKDLELLLKHIQEKKNHNPELVGYVLEQLHQNEICTGKASQNTPFLSLDDRPLSATE